MATDFNVLSADMISTMTWPINALEELRDAELLGDTKAIAELSKIDFSSLINAQRAYKSAIIKSTTIQTLVRMLVPRMQKGPRERTERDENVISLILHIWRNLAAIKDRSVSSFSSAEAMAEANMQVCA